MAAEVTLDHPVAYDNKDVLRRLLELYLYDFSEFDGRDLGPHVTYGYPYRDHYWTEPDRFPFFIRGGDRWRVSPWSVSWTAPRTCPSSS